MVRGVHRDFLKLGLLALPLILIPAVIAGFRGGERGVLRAAATGAMMGATGGKGPGALAEHFFKPRKQ